MGKALAEPALSETFPLLSSPCQLFLGLQQLTPASAKSLLRQMAKESLRCRLRLVELVALQEYSAPANEGRGRATGVPTLFWLRSLPLQVSLPRYPLPSALLKHSGTEMYP